LPALAWKEFAQAALAGQPLLDWPRAPSVYSVPVRIDPRNGRRAADGCPYARVLVLAGDRIPKEQSDCPDDLRAVPNLAGMTAREATSAVEGSGLAIRLDVRPARPGDTPGTVALQVPQPLESAPADSVVTVQIAADVPSVLIPPLRFENRQVDLSEAVRLLTAARFRVVVLEGASGPGPVGTVVGQQPRPGAQAALGSVVSLRVVGRPPGVVTLPRVGGLTLAEARVRLVTAGVAVTPRRVGGPAFAGDRVVSTLPAAGARVPRGSLVTVTAAPAA
jgi:beta-lactam-binding protein with PASTA domain